MYYNQKERLEIVLNIVKKLKNFEGKNNEIINLYDENLCSFVSEFKIICQNYIKQDENNLVDYKGILDFVEINKIIKYNLPVLKIKKPLFVIRAK